MKGRYKKIDTLISYGYTPILDTQRFTPARITAVHRGRYEMVYDGGNIFGKLKTSVYYNADDYCDFPTVGDYVLVQLNELGDSLIVKTLERSTVFIRKDPASKLHKSAQSDSSQAVAANFDYVFIVSSLNKDFNIGRIERYLTLTLQSGAIPVIILTKSDLVDSYDAQISEIREISPSTDIVAVSSVTGDGLEQLSFYLKPRKTIVFLGSSGVGKSSLVNALSGNELMKVNDIREDDSKGRHTTTYRQLIKLDCGAVIIDTPGMRELGMWDVSSGLDDAFADVTSYFGKCRFSNCTHTNEPGCAVLEALANGELSSDRLDAYNALMNEATITKTKLERRLEGKEFGRIMHKHRKEHKKR